MHDSPQHHPRAWPIHRCIALVLLTLVLLAGAAIVFLPIGWELNRFIVWLYYWL